MTTLAPLPAPLPTVEVPRFLSPSRFDDLLSCKLSVLAEREAQVQLPPSPQAIFGSILHHLRHEWAEGRYEPGSSVSESVTKTLEIIAARIVRTAMSDLFPDVYCERTIAPNLMQA